MDSPAALKSMDAHAGMLEPQPFDEYDDGQMHDILGNERLAKPVQALLLTLRQIEATQASFGPEHMNTKRVMEALLPDLRKLRDACKEEWGGS